MVLLQCGDDVVGVDHEASGVALGLCPRLINLLLGLSAHILLREGHSLLLSGFVEGFHLLLEFALLLLLEFGFELVEDLHNQVNIAHLLNTQALADGVDLNGELFFK